MENEIPENVNQAQSTTNDPSIGQQILDSIADNALYQAFDSAVDKIVDVTKPAINAITNAAGTTVKKVESIPRFARARAILASLPP